MFPVRVLAGVHGPDLATVVVLTLAAASTAVVAGLGIAAFVRRRSRSYLLVALALSALVARTAVGVGAYVAFLGADAHHLLEHGLDVAMAALVVAAVFLVRRTDPGDGRGAVRTDGAGEVALEASDPDPTGDADGDGDESASGGGGFVSEGGFASDGGGGGPAR